MLDAFPDARAVLRELKRRGEATAILSNGSPKMLAAAVEAAKIGGDLDAVLSVDAIRIYKPRPEVYGLVTEHFKLAPGGRRLRLIEPLGRHGAAAFGFRTVWVNRANMPEEYRTPPKRCSPTSTGS